MKFRELLMIVIKNDTAVYFVMDKQKANYHPEYHLNSVAKMTTRLECLKISDLVDCYPLASYIVDGHQVIPLKHNLI